MNLKRSTVFNNKIRGTVIDKSTFLDHYFRTIREIMKTHGQGLNKVELVVDQTRQILRQAQAAFVTSGTATIETALRARWSSENAGSGSTAMNGRLSSR